MGIPSRSYGASPAIWDYTVLPATRHTWTCPALTTAIQAICRFTYPRGTEGWVDLGVGWLYNKMVFPVHTFCTFFTTNVRHTDIQTDVQCSSHYYCLMRTCLSASLVFIRLSAISLIKLKPILSWYNHINFCNIVHFLLILLLPERL